MKAHISKRLRSILNDPVSAKELQKRLTEYNRKYKVTNKEQTKMLLLVPRLIKHIAILLLVILPLQVLGLVLVPIGVKLQKDYKFPVWLKWFDNADVWIGRDAYTYKHLVDTGMYGDEKISLYYWLAVRNPINYFGYAVLGFKLDKGYIYFDSGDVNKNIGDTTDDEAGFVYRELYDHDSLKIYEYYYVHKWSDNKCLRFRMGHKIGNKPNYIGDWIQYVFTLQPYKDYWGK